MKSKVYFSKTISPEKIIELIELSGKKLPGSIAVKVHSGEVGNQNFLRPEFWKPVVDHVGGTIVECNTAYGGGRAKTEDHLKAAADHGFTAIAPVDIMDAEGEVRLPVEGGRHLKYDIVGSHFPEYDFVVVLSHFKGHAMGGFGGAIKTISIGIASSAGKAWIHSAGKTEDTEKLWSSLPAQDDFLESMAESAKSVADHCGDRILYISVMNNLFGGGMSSRLFQEIREKLGLVYTVYGFANSHTQTGISGIYAGTTADELQKLLPVVAQEIKKVCYDKVDIKELNRAKAQIKASMLMALESSSSTSEVIARQMLLFDRVLPIKEMVEKIENVTLDDIRDTATRIFSSKPTYTLLGSLKKYPDYEQLQQLIKL